MLVALVVVLAGLAVYFGISGLMVYVVVKERRMPIRITPATLGLAYEDVSFSSREDGLMLKGWYIPGGKGTVIVVHGGKQNRADATMQLLELCSDLARRGFNLLTFDRRGCGESEIPGLRGKVHFERDLGGAVDFIRSRNGPREPIFLFGVSLGAVAALAFAAREEGVTGIVSDSCFVGIPELVKGVFARQGKILAIFIPGAFFLGKLVYGFEPVSAINLPRAVKCPILFIHGGNDNGVPVSEARRLFEASNKEQNELWVVPGAGHSQAYKVAPEQYIDKVTAFLNRKITARNNP